MLCTIGDLVTDVVVRPWEPLRHGSDAHSLVVHRQGGSAANVAVAAAGRIAVRFVGQVGLDRRGDDLVNDLRAAGVEPVVSRAGTTGTVIVILDESGERSFLTDRGAATQVGHIDPAVLVDVEWLHLPGYSFTEGPLADASYRIVGEAVERGIPVSLSTSSTGVLADFGPPEFLDLIGAIGPEVVVANRPEADLLLGDTHRFPATRYSIITSGADPTRLTTGNATSLIEVPSTAGVADTTGAGDAFTGGLLAALMAGDRPPDAIRAGHRVAARTLEGSAGTGRSGAWE